MRSITNKTDIGFRYEDPSDPDTCAVIFANNDDGLTVSVSEEFAMDSYNRTFECTVCMDKVSAEKLRDYLLKYFPI